MSSSSAGSDGASSDNPIYGYIMIIAVCITTAGLTEATEIAESKFDYAFIMRYICMATGILSAIPTLTWKICSPRTKILKSDKQIYFYIWSLIGSLVLTSAGMVYFSAFDGVSVPTATALGGTRAVMVLILSVIILKEELILWKIMAVIVSILGILCYVYEAEHKQDNNGGGVQDTVWGCFLCLIANFMFAFCDVIAGKVSQAYDHKILGSLYYQIFQGLYQLPLFLWVWWWPETPTTENKMDDWDNIWWCIFPAIALTANNASIFIGVTIKSPFYVNIGTLLGIPLSLVVDMFVHHYKPTLIPIAGTILLIISFLMLEVIKPPKNMVCFNWIMINGHKEENEDNKGKEDGSLKEKLEDPLIINDGIYKL